MFIKVFLLLVGLSTAYAIKCYVCVGKDCTPQVVDCGSVPGADRCFVGEANGIMARGCIPEAACTNSISCCKGDLCNGVGPTGPTVLLLIVSSAVFTLFL